MDRRHFLAGLGAVTLVTEQSLAASTATPQLNLASMRGTLDATQYGVRPDAHDDQSQILQKVLDRAASEDKPVFLPPGRYVVSNIDLTSLARIMGVPGDSQIVYRGQCALLSGTGNELIHLTCFVVDGANQPLGDSDTGLFPYVAYFSPTLQALFPLNANNSPWRGQPLDNTYKNRSGQIHPGHLHIEHRNG